MYVLQLGHPKVASNSKTSLKFKRIQDSFLTVFNAEEESFYLYWDQKPLRFRYSQDLYKSFDSILATLWLIQCDMRGEIKAFFSTQIIDMRWQILWREDELVIYSTFSACESLYTLYAQALSQSPILRISKSDFLSEWKTLLHQIIVAFKASRVEIEDGTERRKWELLQQVEQKIPNYGKLYTPYS